MKLQTRKAYHIKIWHSDWVWIFLRILLQAKDVRFACNVLRGPRFGSTLRSSEIWLVPSASFGHKPCGHKFIIASLKSASFACFDRTFLLCAFFSPCEMWLLKYARGAKETIFFWQIWKLRYAWSGLPCTMFWQTIGMKLPNKHRN